MDNKNITVDGITYAVDQFSPGIQQAATIYSTFLEDLTKARIEVVKCEAALQTIGNQIGAAVKIELAKKAADASAAAESMEPAPAPSANDE